MLFYKFHPTLTRNIFVHSVWEVFFVSLTKCKLGLARRRFIFKTSDRELSFLAYEVNFLHSTRVLLHMEQQSG